MKKYDIIFDFEKSRFTMEKSGMILEQIKEFLLDWREEVFSRKPEVDSVVMGIEIYELIRLSPKYSNMLKNIEIYEVVFDCRGDWSVHPNYLEINLK